MIKIKMIKIKMIKIKMINDKNDKADHLRGNDHLNCL